MKGPSRLSEKIETLIDSLIDEFWKSGTKDTLIEAKNSKCFLFPPLTCFEKHMLGRTVLSTNGNIFLFNDNQ
jgi:hypothetical protein